MRNSIPSWASPRLDPAKRYGEQAQPDDNRGRDHEQSAQDEASDAYNRSNKGADQRKHRIARTDPHDRKSRLTEYVGSLDKQTMESVDRAIVVSFGIQYLEGLIKWEKEQA